ncbi:MAG TPA: tetratricopeptide repeat protein [Acidobacteriota bacterium]|nr:tetratricopeptide repeat protein [Acidobacteriota bacterium]
MSSAQDHYNKGMQHFVQDQLDEAIAELEKALQVDSDHADSLQALAMSYFHQNELEKAVKYGERFRDLEPENAMAYTSLSMFYQRQGRIEEAEDMGALAAKYTKSGGDA